MPMRYIQTLSIQARLVLFVILPVFILSCVMLFLDYQYQLHHEENKLKNYAQTTAKFVAAIVKVDGGGRDPAGIQDLLKSIPLQADKYLALTILNAQNQPVMTVGQAFKLPQPLPKVDVTKISLSDKFIALASIANDQLMQPQGSVLVAVDKAGLVRDYQFRLFRNIVIVAVFLALCSMLILWVSRSISQPIRDMTVALKNLMNGQHGLTQLKHSLPEIKKLQSTLNEISIEMQNAEANMRDSIQDAQAQLRYQARHDALTGLVNRQELERRLNQALQDVKRYQSSHVFCYMDLDQFRVVNDTCGHLAGDEMLRQISMILTQRIRAEDTLSRLGGDEFGLLLSYCSLEKAIEIAAQLRLMVENYRFIHDGRNFQTAMSVGIVQITADMEDVGQITRHADAACYVAKERGRNQVHLFYPEDDVLLKRHVEMEWVSKINEAIDYNDFVLYCQCIYPLQQEDGIPFFEILIRKRDEQRGVILPAEFLPSAERYNLMTKIDRWAIQHTFIALQPIFNMDKLKTFTVSINLSGTSLSDPGLLAFIQSCLNTYEIPPGNVCFEITETSAIINLDNTIRLITELRKIGTRFMLDDFGSGMSSFSYLKHLPVDFLKMDGAYVRDITLNKVDFAMANAIQHVAESMQITTIAEYVENAETLECLKEMGVGYAQGFYLSKPRALSETIDLLMGDSAFKNTSVMLDVN